MPKEQYRTSRGQFAETEEIISNLLAAVEHIQDTSLDEHNIKLIKRIRDIRGKLIKQLFPENEVDLAYHCAYKHLLLAKMQLKETIQSYITYGEKPYDLEELLSEINDQLGVVRAKYLNIDPADLDDPGCAKCTEDYLMKGKED